MAARSAEDIADDDPVRVALEMTWPAANPVDSEALREHLAGAYQRTPVAVVALDNAWRADWADEDEPSWIVRVASKHRPVPSVAADAALLHYLATRGVPAERCAAEQAVTQMDSRAVMVTVCEQGIEGADRYETWVRLGDIAGRLATVLLPPDGVAVARDVGAYPNQTPLLSLRGEMENVVACLGAVEKDVPVEHVAFYGRMLDYVATEADFDALPRGVVHPDLAPVNAFETPDRGLLPVDWAGAGVGPRIGTLAVLLAYTTMRPDGWLPTLGRDMLSAFVAHATLEDAELGALPSLVERRLFVREAVGLCIGIRYGIPPLYVGQWTRGQTAVASIAEMADALR